MALYAVDRMSCETKQPKSEALSSRKRNLEDVEGGGGMNWTTS